MTTTGTFILSENDTPSPSGAALRRRVSVDSTGTLQITDSAGITTSIGSGGASYVLVYRPAEVTPAGNVFNNFNLLFDAFEAARGFHLIQIDAHDQGDNYTVTLPVRTGGGAYDFEDGRATIESMRKDGAAIKWAAGATIVGLREVGRWLEMYGSSNAVPVCSEVVAFIVFGDYSGISQEGTNAPFVQASVAAIIDLVGTGTYVYNYAATHPAVKVTGATAIQLSLVGPYSNVTGANVLECEPTGFVNTYAFGAGSVVGPNTIKSPVGSTASISYSPDCDPGVVTNAQANALGAFTRDALAAAQRVAYTPAAPANWSVAPTTPKGALDSVAKSSFIAALTWAADKGVYFTAPLVAAVYDLTAAGRAFVGAASVAAQTAILNAFVGDSGAGGTKGMVPAPAAGDAAALKYLNADGTWTAPNAVTAVVNQWLTNAEPLSPHASDLTPITNGGPTGLTTFDPAAVGGGAAPIQNGQLEITSNTTTNKSIYFYKAVPAGGEFAVYTELTHNGPYSNYRTIGLALGNAGVATNTSPLMMVLGHDDVALGNPYNSLRTYNATAISSTTVAAAATDVLVQRPLYQRMLVNGTNVTVWTSQDGRIWRQLGGTHAIGFTPSFIGVFGFHSVGTEKTNSACRFLRFFSGVGSSVPGANNIGRFVT